MKKLSHQGKKVSIPICPMIDYVLHLSSKVLTRDDIKTFNAYYHFSCDIEKTSGYLNSDFYQVTKKTVNVLRKLVFLYSIKSDKRFMQGILTKKEFLSAPLGVHGLSKRLYNLLTEMGAFNLQEVIDLGVYKLKRKKGFGHAGLKELMDIFIKNGYGHLLK